MCDSASGPVFGRFAAVWRSRWLSYLNCSKVRLLSNWTCVVESDWEYIWSQFSVLPYQATLSKSRSDSGRELPLTQWSGSVFQYAWGSTAEPYIGQRRSWSGCGRSTEWARWLVVLHKDACKESLKAWTERSWFESNHLNWHCLKQVTG